MDLPRAIAEVNAATQRLAATPTKNEAERRQAQAAVAAALNRVAEATARAAPVLTQPQRKIPTEARETFSFVLTPDGSRFYVASNGGDIYAYDFATGQRQFAITGREFGGTPYLAVSPDGTTLAAAGTIQEADNKQKSLVHLWDLKTRRLRQTLHGKLYAMSALAFSADGKTLAVGGGKVNGGGHLELWDLPSGKVRTGEFADWVLSLAFPPGREDLLAVGTMGGSVLMVNPATAKAEYPLSQPGPIGSLAISPDGKWLAAGGGEGKVRLWEWQSGRLAGTLIGHGIGDVSVRFSPDSRRLLTMSADYTTRGTTKLWDVATCKLLATVANDLPIARFTPDGKSIITAGTGGMVSVWDLAVLTVADGPAGPRQAVTEKAKADVDDARAQKKMAEAAGRGQGEARCRPTNCRRVRGPHSAPTTPATVNALIQPKRSFPTDAGPITSAVFTPDGNMLAVADWEGKIRPYDFATGNQRFEIILDKRASGDCRFLAVSPDGATIAAVGTDQTIRVIDTATGRVRQTRHGSPHPYNSVAFSPDGKTIAAGGFGPDGPGGLLRGGLLEMWDPASGNVKTVEFLNPVWVLAFAPGHPEWLAVGTGSDGVRMVDVPSAKEKYSGREPGPVRALAFSPDGRWLAASAGDNRVHIGTSSNGWRTVMHRGVDQLNGIIGRVNSISVSPDGKLLATASLDGTAKLWEVRRHRCVETFAPASDKTGAVALFTPDGKSLVTAGDDHMIRVWNVPALPDGRPGGQTGVPVISDVPILGELFQNRVTEERQKAEEACASGGQSPGRKGRGSEGPRRPALDRTAAFHRSRRRRADTFRRVHAGRQAVIRGWAGSARRDSSSRQRRTNANRKVGRYAAYCRVARRQVFRHRRPQRRGPTMANAASHGPDFARLFNGHDRCERLCLRPQR